MSEPALTKKFVQTSQANVAYLEAGGDDRPPVLLVHGIPTSSYLWRHVLRFLQNDVHCYAPDLMGLGDTDLDPDTGRFDMEAQSEMLLEFMQALGHERFAVVCHDQGGAAVQLLAARRPEQLTCLVCTDCVCYDNWPVPVIARLQAFTHMVPGYEWLTGTGIFRWKEMRTPFSAFRGGVYDPATMSDASIEEYLRPIHAGPRERRRFLNFLRAGSARYSLEAVEGLKRFEKPTLIVWAADDRYISPSWGRKLYEDIPGAERFELIPFCGHFWQEERPVEFASIIGEFLARHARPQKTRKKQKGRK